MSVQIIFSPVDDQHIQALVDQAIHEGLPFLEPFDVPWDVKAANQTSPSFAKAMVDGALVGWAILRQDDWLDDASIGRISHVYVRSEFRRQGIARQLMQALAPHYAQYKRVRLHADNLEAAALYESLGFVAVDEPHTTHGIEMLSYHMN